MFVLIQKVRCLIDTLRVYAKRRSISPIRPKHELYVLVEAIFNDPETVVSPSPLPSAGQEIWNRLVRYSRTTLSREKARQAALEFADWLTKQYMPKDRVVFDADSVSVMIDGEFYENLKPLEYALIKVLNDRRGLFTSTEAIIASINAGGAGAVADSILQQLSPFPDTESGKKRIVRCLEQMNYDLRRYIDGQRRSGRRLLLPTR